MPLSPEDNQSHSATKPSPSNPTIEAILLLLFPIKGLADSFALAFPALRSAKIVPPRLDAEVSAQRKSLCALSEIELAEIHRKLIARNAASVKARTAEKQADTQSKLVAVEAARFFNEPNATADFQYWAKAEYWTFNESLALLLGKNPTLVTPATIEREKNKEFLLLTPDKPSRSSFIRTYEQLRQLAERATVMRAPRLKPVDVLQWAQRTGVAIPPPELTTNVLAQIQKLEDPPQAVTELLETISPNITTGRQGPRRSGESENWTEQELLELKAYRAAHGTEAAAEMFGIAGSRVRKLLPTRPPKPPGYSAFKSGKP